MNCKELVARATEEVLLGRSVVLVPPKDGASALMAECWAALLPRLPVGVPMQMDQLKRKLHVGDGVIRFVAIPEQAQGIEFDTLFHHDTAAADVIEALHDLYRVRWPPPSRERADNAALDSRAP